MFDIKKLNIKVNEGKRRLRLSISAISAIGTYVYLIVGAYRLEIENIFITFPLVSVLAFGVIYLLVTIFYWILEGFEKDKKAINTLTHKSSTTDKSVESLSK